MARTRRPLLAPLFLGLLPAPGDGLRAARSDDDPAPPAASTSS